jgi:hypothetical protein
MKACLTTLHFEAFQVNYTPYLVYCPFFYLFPINCDKIRDHIVRWASVLDKPAVYAKDKGSYLVVEKVEQEALDARVKVLGKGHRDGKNRS